MCLNEKYLVHKKAKENSIHIAFMLLGSALSVRMLKGTCIQQQWRIQKTELRSCLFSMIDSYILSKASEYFAH